MHALIGEVTNTVDIITNMINILSSKTHFLWNSIKIRSALPITTDPSLQLGQNPLCLIVCHLSSPQWCCRVSTRSELHSLCEMTINVGTYGKRDHLKEILKQIIMLNKLNPQRINLWWNCENEEWKNSSCTLHWYNLWNAQGGCLWHQIISSGY